MKGHFLSESEYFFPLRRWKRAFTAALALAFGLGLSACDDDGVEPVGDAQVQILLTDAPSDYIASADVWISRVYLQPDDTDDADDDGVDDGEDPDVPGRVDLFNDPDNPKQFDLLTLRDGIVAELTDPVTVEAGEYGQLRLVVDSAIVTLADGFTFPDGSQTDLLFVPSGQQNGIKVQLSGDIDADGGELVTLLVDFDVDRNFKVQGNPNTAAGIQSILFTPVLVEIDRDEEETGGATGS